MDCLILKFKGAGIYSSPQWSKDKVCDSSGVHDRKTFPTMDIPIGTLSKRHISNVLHVLMGERPAPSLRSSFIKPIDEIKALADESRVKIESVIGKDKDGKEFYLREIKNIRKSIGNSWNTSSHNINLKGIDKPLKGLVLSWANMKLYLGDELYSEFIELTKTLLGEKYLSERIEDVISSLSLLSSSKMSEFIKLCSFAHKEPFAHLLRGDTTKAAFNQASDINVRRTVCKGVESISRIDGTIYIPMTDEFFNRIKNGPGSATILEGGVVYIDGVADFSENLISDTMKPVE
jgi:hypothetical protein